MQIIDAVLGPFDETALAVQRSAERRPVGRVAVLDDERATIVEQRKECLDGRDLLCHGVAAVVDDDVERAAIVVEFA